jgi:signal transduction histidine kinase
MLTSNPPVLSVTATDTDINTMQTFMGMLAHEIKSYITGICTTSNLLLENKIMVRDRKFYLSNINSMSLNALHVLNNMMVSSLVNAGKLEIKAVLSTIHTRKWLKSHIHQHQKIANSRLINIKLTINRKVPEFFTTDVIKLAQILKNLMENAFKYSPLGSTIFIHVASLAENGLFFMVTDHGTGISSDKVHLLFQPFQSLDNGLAGTGLGLYISKLYAKALGGDLVLASNDENGTSFFLQIPNQLTA